MKKRVILLLFAFLCCVVLETTVTKGPTDFVVVKDTSVGSKKGHKLSKYIKLDKMNLDSVRHGSKLIQLGNQIVDIDEFRDVINQRSEKRNLSRRRKYVDISPSYQDLLNETLFSAVHENKFSDLQMLVAMGAEVEAQKNGKAPLQLAQELHNEECAAILRRFFEENGDYYNSSAKKRLKRTKKVFPTVPQEMLIPSDVEKPSRDVESTLEFPPVSTYDPVFQIDTFEVCKRNVQDRINIKLLEAVKANNTNEIKVLLQRGAKQNIMHDDDTPLIHLAYMQGNLEGAQVLLEADTYALQNESLKDSECAALFPKTPLYMSTDDENLFNTYQRNYQAKLKDRLIEAITAGNKDEIVRLLQMGAQKDIRIAGGSLFSFALDFCDLDTAELLV